jgi:hypothetical protein
LVWEKGVEPKVDKMPSLPKALKEAIEVAGGITLKTSAGRGKEAGIWLRDQLGASRLDFDRAAVVALEDLIGDDSGRVVGIVRTLEGALGEGSTVTADDIATYGGSEKGGTVPWALDDAIDKGDVAEALGVLQRRGISSDGHASTALRQHASSRWIRRQLRQTSRRDPRYEGINLPCEKGDAAGPQARHRTLVAGH